jgi:hypothetical protein
MAAGFVVLLAGCSSIESTHVVRDQYGVTKGERFDGVPIVVTVPDKLGFLVTEETYRITRPVTDSAGMVVAGKFVVTEEVVTKVDKEPVPLGSAEVFTVDVRRPASGTAENSIELKDQYPTSIKGKVDDKTLDTAIGAVEKLQGLVKNADTPGGPGSGPGVTRELVKTKQYMMVYDPRTGQFTRQ